MTGRPGRGSRLKAALDRLYLEYDRAAVVADPVELVRRYREPADREVAGLIASALAFGRVAGIMQSVTRVLDCLGPSPAQAVRQFDPVRGRCRLDEIRHRWTGGADIVALVWAARQMIEEAGSIERFLLEGDPGNTPDVGPAIESFSRRALEFDFRPVYPRLPERPGVAYFFPRPSGGGACKRLNLYVRWMVRHDEVDLGVWPSVSRARLVVPLDTHVIRVGRCLGLTARRTPGWRMAAEITGALRALDPDDPVRYDFALCHVGMHGLCGHDRPQGDERCPLKGLCSPHAAAARAEPGGQAGAARRASSSARR